MSLVNFTAREITCKIVYYGPGRSGKTTNLHYVYERVPETRRGRMVSLATQTDRTLFFDFLPIDLGQISGFSTRFQLYTVPGQVYYNATRRLVLQGADGVVFVADSQARQLDENIESLQNLQANLLDHGVDVRAMPLVIQSRSIWYCQEPFANRLSPPWSMAPVAFRSSRLLSGSEMLIRRPWLSRVSEA